MNQVELMRTLLAPVVSEKSTFLAERDRQFVFRVQPAANKAQIRRAVELMFNVEVESVRVMNVKGKQKRFGRFMGRRSDWKKAYVKLKPGFDIELAVS
jgi:large subunit ribosomal protein L23